jgi:TRAP-type uncharacterized transport system substrate-binding protein
MSPKNSKRAGWISSTLLKYLGSTAVLLLLGFLLAYQFVGPPPPERVVMVTGASEGAYARFALGYQAALARQGITLELRPSSGTLENLRVLGEDNDVQLALVQSGCAGPEIPGNIWGLASVAYEPLWIFHRKGLAAARLLDFKGLRMAAGSAESGTRAIVLELLKDNGLDAGSVTLLDLGGSDAADALQRGEVDAACFVTALPSPLILELMHSESLELFDFTRAESYARHHRYLSPIALPRGVLDLGADLPRRNQQLIAPTATLVARDDLHPAISDLLLQAAAEVHAEGTWISDPGSFPSKHHLDFPLSKEAHRYFKYGPPFLQRYMPFWAASLIDRLKVMLLPLLTLLIPLAKILPPAYRSRMRRRTYQWYDDLIALDQELGSCKAPAEVAQLLERLERIETEAGQVTVPLSMADEMFELKVHIQHVRSKAQALAAQWV